MNKKLLSVAVVAALALPMAANAGAVKVYGQVHVALQSVTDGDADAVWDIDGTSSKANKLGAKGSVDTNLMDFKAVYQFEIGLNQTKTSFGTKKEDDGSFTHKKGTDGVGIYFQRDTWVGLSSKSMGTVRGGTVTSAWKSTSKLVDPLFTTALESRAGVVGGASSNLAGGKSPYSGRSTHAVRYDSPSIAGAKITANYAFASGKDAIGAGVLYKMGGISAFANFQSTDEDLTATKVGAKIKMGSIGISGAYEKDGGAIGGFKDSEKNQLNLAATYGMGATTLILKFGKSDESISGAKDDRTGFGFAVSQKLAKKVSIYAGWGKSTGDTSSQDMSALAIGMKAGF